MTQIKTKLSAVRAVIEGQRSQLAVAREYGVGRASIYDWIKQHHAGKDLSGPIVQREKYYLDPDKLKHDLATCKPKCRPRILALIDLHRSGGKVAETAALHGVTSQCLMGWRRAYCAGKWA